MKSLLCAWGVLLTLPWALPVQAYDFPMTDPLAATVVGTPPELQADLPAEIPLERHSLRIFPEREVPGVLWHLAELRYALVRQDRPAPLIFLIAGTGSSDLSRPMEIMQKAFYQAGFHVATLPSPTHPNFIVAASESGFPGHTGQDAVDLHRAMGKIVERHGHRLEITGYFLAGFSLGGTQAAFVAKHDREVGTFGFERVLMVNPPVSLVGSVLLLEQLMERNIPGGDKNVDRYFARLLTEISEIYRPGEKVEIDEDFLYAAYREREADKEDLAALVGFAFRFASSSMAFTSDVLEQAGYVVPTDSTPGRHDSVTRYLLAFNQLSFMDYLEDLLLPHLRSMVGEEDREEILRQFSLRSIEEFLRSERNLGLMHNRDDPLLLPGEIDYLEGIFGDRAMIYPRGGHGGNLDFRDNVRDMVEFFRP